MKVVGRRKYQFTNKETGEMIVGVSLHCLENSPDPSEGQLATTLSVVSAKPCYSLALGIPFGSEVTPVYNKYGKVDDILIRDTPDTPDSKAK